MNAIKLGVLSLVFLASGYGETFDPSGPEVSTKTYESYAFRDTPYELAHSTIRIGVDCAENQAVAETLITDKTLVILGLLDQKLKALRITSHDDLNGYDLSQKIEVGSKSPWSDEADLNEKEKKYVYKNRCTNEESPIPMLGAKRVYSANRIVTIRLANEETRLLDLEALVKSVEQLTEKGAATVKVESVSDDGAPYQLDVSEKTRKELLAQVEEEARKRVESKRQLAHEKADYDAIWAIDNGFRENAKLGHLNAKVVKENGSWVAKFSASDSRWIYGKRGAIANGGHLLTHESIEVSAKAEATDKLYARLDISVGQGCFLSKEDANAFESNGDVNQIIAGIKEINKGETVELDYLAIKPVTVSEQGTHEVFTEMSVYNLENPNRPTTQYFNRCTGLVVAEEPETSGYFRASRSMSIVSSKLDVLSTHAEKLISDYRRDTESKPNELQVAVSSSWGVAVEVADRVNGQLQRELDSAFKRELECNKFGLVTVCESQPAQVDPISPPWRSHETKEAAFMQPEGASDPVERPVITATERGLRRIEGVYFYTDIVRNEFFNNLSAGK